MISIIEVRESNFFNKFADNLVEICENHFYDNDRAREFYNRFGDSVAVRNELIWLTEKFTFEEIEMEKDGYIWDGEWSEALAVLVERYNEKELNPDEVKSLCEELVSRYMTL